MLKGIQQRLGLPTDLMIPSYATLGEYGNTSCSTTVSDGGTGGHRLGLGGWEGYPQGVLFLHPRIQCVDWCEPLSTSTPLQWYAFGYVESCNKVKKGQVRGRGGGGARRGREGTEDGSGHVSG